MSLLRLINSTVWLASVLLLTSCSSHIPPEIRKAIAGAPDIAKVNAAPDQYLSQSVRWGGVILNTDNKENTSLITIVGFPLDAHGEPIVSDKSSGRFIAVVDKFLEPLVYSRDRMITILGKLLKMETLDVGEFPYDYPVIKVSHHYLWPVKIETEIVHHPLWWHDPFSPWHYPYYPYYPRSKKSPEDKDKEKR